MVSVNTKIYMNEHMHNCIIYGDALYLNLPYGFGLILVYSIIYMIASQFDAKLF